MHAVFRVNLYDRYLLLLLPLLILPVARGLAALCESYASRLLPPIVVALVLISAVGTFNGHTPVAGDRVAYWGIDELADYLKGKPVATVIYDPWLGWQLDYYLGPWHDKRRVHYPTADCAGRRRAVKLDERGARYLVTPLGKPYEAWLAALRDAGFAVREAYRRGRFLAFRLLPPKN